LAIRFSLLIELPSADFSQLRGGLREIGFEWLLDAQLAPVPKTLRISPDEKRANAIFSTDKCECSKNTCLRNRKITLLFCHRTTLAAHMVRYGKKDKRVALYLRVSTGEQTTRNQRRELEEAAKRHSWKIAATFEDAGISGAKGRKDRPGLDALLKAVTRREVDMVMAWSVDRLGRSLVDLLATLQELHAKDVDLYLHQQGLDTSTPSGRAMFQMMGVFSEFERAMIQERVKAGLARAKDDGVTLGRPTLESTDPERAAEVRAMRSKGVGVRKIAKTLGVGVGTVLRLSV
jgi:DNA invertase Pin-like site-specific DNA recombinase